MPTATLRNWKLRFDFTSKEEVYYLSGNIYYDEKDRFLDGTRVHTSKLVKIDFENKIAETKNTIYNLISMEE